MITLSEGEKVSAVVPVRKLEEGKNIIMATQQGYIKRVNLMEFINIRRSGMRAIFLDEGDKLIGARISDGTNDCLISSAKGMSIRFTEEDVRIMGRSARGVTAINLDAGDEVVSLETVPSKDSDTGLLLFTACQNGYGKRTFVSDYRPQSRAGKGLIDIKTEDRNGPVVVALQVHETDQVMIITSGSQVIRVPVSEVPLRSRNTMGVRLVQLTEGERICAMARIVDDGSGLGEADLPEGGGAEVTPEVATEAAPESEEVSDSGDLPTDVH
jgi:DNA gyrase subunit A